ncbi:hypothetical protein MMC11_008296 [Xylographa trunciseda]|nr:hypothetical protein [Xylographa trunciseda]
MAFSIDWTIDCHMGIDIVESKVQHVAMALFNVHVEVDSDAQARQIVALNGVRITPSPEISLVGAHDEAMLELFGPKISGAIKASRILIFILIRLICSCFWTMAYILFNPRLLVDICKEVVAVFAEGTANVEARLASCPMLEGAALGLTGASGVIRNVRYTTELGEVTLQRNRLRTRTR